MLVIVVLRVENDTTLKRYQNTPTVTERLIIRKIILKGLLELLFFIPYFYANIGYNNNPMADYLP